MFGNTDVFRILSVLANSGYRNSRRSSQSMTPGSLRRSLCSVVAVKCVPPVIAIGDAQLTSRPSTGEAMAIVDERTRGLAQELLHFQAAHP